MWLYKLVILALLCALAYDRAWHIFENGRQVGFQQGYQQGLKQQPQAWKTLEEQGKIH